MQISRSGSARIGAGVEPECVPRLLCQRTPQEEVGCLLGLRNVDHEQHTQAPQKVHAAGSQKTFLLKKAEVVVTTSHSMAVPNTSRIAHAVG